jgi:hypothetical protein
MEDHGSADLEPLPGDPVFGTDSGHSVTRVGQADDFRPVQGGRPAIHGPTQNLHQEAVRALHGCIVPESRPAKPLSSNLRKSLYDLPGPEHARSREHLLRANPAVSMGGKGVVGKKDGPENGWAEKTLPVERKGVGERSDQPRKSP